jgi:hypothetical protein
LLFGEPFKVYIGGHVGGLDRERECLLVEGGPFQRALGALCRARGMTPVVVSMLDSVDLRFDDETPADSLFYALAELSRADVAILLVSDDAPEPPTERGSASADTASHDAYTVAAKAFPGVKPFVNRSWAEAEAGFALGPLRARGLAVAVMDGGRRKGVLASTREDRPSTAAVAVRALAGQQGALYPFVNLEGLVARCAAVVEAALAQRHPGPLQQQQSVGPVGVEALSLERQRCRLEALASGYVYRRTYFQAMGEATKPYMRDLPDGQRLLLVAGREGAGKSSLLAAWTAHIASSTPRQVVLTHLTEADDRRKLSDILTYLIALIKRRFSATVPLLAEVEAPLPGRRLIDEFRSAARLAARAVYPDNLVFCIDDIDRIEYDCGDDVPEAWTPTRVSSNIVVLASVLRDGEFHVLAETRQQTPVFRIRALYRREKQLLVDSVFARFSLPFPEDSFRSIIGIRATENPRFLKTLALEAALCSLYYETPEETVERLKAADSVPELLAMVFQRLERVVDRNIAQRVFSAACCSEVGATEAALAAFAPGVPRLALEPLYELLQVLCEPSNGVFCVADGANRAAMVRRYAMTVQASAPARGALRDAAIDALVVPRPTTAEQKLPPRPREAVEALRQLQAVPSRPVFESLLRRGGLDLVQEIVEIGGVSLLLATARSCGVAELGPALWGLLEAASPSGAAAAHYDAAATVLCENGEFPPAASALHGLAVITLDVLEAGNVKDRAEAAANSGGGSWEESPEELQARRAKLIGVVAAHAAARARLADVFLRAGNVDEALEEIDAVVPQCEPHVDGDQAALVRGPYTKVLLLHALLLRRGARYGDAITRCAMAIEALGPDARGTRAYVDLLDCLGASLLKAGRLREALSALEEALSAAKVVYGPQHPVAARQMHALAMASTEAAKFPRALALARAAHRVYVDCLGGADPRVKALEQLLVQIDAFEHEHAARRRAAARARVAPTSTAAKANANANPTSDPAKPRALARKIAFREAKSKQKAEVDAVGRLQAYKIVPLPPISPNPDRTPAASAPSSLNTSYLPTPVASRPETAVPDGEGEGDEGESEDQEGGDETNDGSAGSRATSSRPQQQTIQPPSILPPIVPVKPVDPQEQALAEKFDRLAKPCKAPPCMIRVEGPPENLPGHKRGLAFSALIMTHELKHGVRLMAKNGANLGTVYRIVTSAGDRLSGLHRGEVADLVLAKPAGRAEIVHFGISLHTGDILKSF